MADDHHHNAFLEKPMHGKFFIQQRESHRLTSPNPMFGCNMQAKDAKLKQQSVPPKTRLW
eukprot:13311383-Ditylum_brightwellii.AAC.1